VGGGGFFFFFFFGGGGFFFFCCVGGGGGVGCWGGFFFFFFWVFSFWGGGGGGGGFGGGLGGGGLRPRAEGPLAPVRPVPGKGNGSGCRLGKELDKGQSLERAKGIRGGPRCFGSRPPLLQWTPMPGGKNFFSAAS